MKTHHPPPPAGPPPDTVLLDVLNRAGAAILVVGCLVLLSHSGDGKDPGIPLLGVGGLVVTAVQYSLIHLFLSQCRELHAARLENAWLIGHAAWEGEQATAARAAQAQCLEWIMERLDGGSPPAGGPPLPEPEPATVHPLDKGRVPKRVPLPPI